MTVARRAVATGLPIESTIEKSFRLYVIALFAMYVGNNIPAPLFELFHRQLGITPSGLSLLYAVYAVAVIVSLPFLGGLSDRVGRRSIVVAGLAINAVGAALMAVAGGLTCLLAGRVLQGISVAAVMSPTLAALAELAPPDVSRRAALVSTLCLATGGSLGPLAAGIAAEFSAWPQSTALLGYAALVVVFLPLLRTADDPAPVQQNRAADRLRMKAIPAAFWRIAGVVFVSNAVQNTLYALGGPRLAEVRPDHVFLATGIGILAFMAASIAGLFIARRFRPTIAMAVGLVLTAGGLGLIQYGLSHGNYVPIVLAVFTSGLGHGMINFGAGQRVNELAPPAHRSLFNSVFNVIRYVGTGLPVLVVGVLSAYVGLTEAFTDFTRAIYALAALFLLLLLAQRETLVLRKGQTPT
jgi:MFS family permease